MTDAVIFGFGFLATLMCAGAVAFLMRAAYLDGKHQSKQRSKQRSMYAPEGSITA